MTVGLKCSSFTDRNKQEIFIKSHSYWVRTLSHMPPPRRPRPYYRSVQLPRENNYSVERKQYKHDKTATVNRNNRKKVKRLVCEFLNTVDEEYSRYLAGLKTIVLYGGILARSKVKRQHHSFWHYIRLRVWNATKMMTSSRLLACRYRSGS